MILEKIVNNRKQLLIKEKELLPQAGLEHRARNMKKPAPFMLGCEKPFVIAEIKKASPSKGIIRKDFDVEKIARSYGKSRYVNALSVLTEPDFFMGSYAYLSVAKKAASKPVLMKDFVVDAYQLYRGCAEGASAALLILSVLSDKDVSALIDVAHSLKMQIIAEAHTGDEYKRALGLKPDIIGINNRDLKTFVTDINATINIINKYGKPGNICLISESGIKTGAEVSALLKAGADGFLIGETLMKSNDIEHELELLFGQCYES